MLVHESEALSDPPFKSGTAFVVSKLCKETARFSPCGVFRFDLQANLKFP